MTGINLKNFMSMFKIGTSIDEGTAFLKCYDKNNNSIFDADELKDLENDLLKADKKDKNDGFLSELDLQFFYKNITKKFKDNIPDKDSMVISIQATANSRLNNLISLRKNKDFDNLSKSQQKVLEAYVVNTPSKSNTDFNYSNLIAEISKLKDENIDGESLNDLLKLFSKEELKLFRFNDYIELLKLNPEQRESFDVLISALKTDSVDYRSLDLIKFVKEIKPQDLEFAKKLLGSEFGEEKNLLWVDDIQSILELDEQKRQKVIDAFNIPQMGKFKYYGIINLMAVEQYMPKDFFSNNSDFNLITFNDKLGYQLPTVNGSITYLYDKEKGLYEIQFENASDNTVKVLNAEAGTEHIIKYADLNSKLQVLSESINQYKQIDLTSDGDFRLVDFQRGTKISELDAKGGVQNVVQTNSDGSVKVLQSSIVNEDGSISIVKDFASSQGVRTEYSYDISQNGNQKLCYKITNSDGEVLLDKHQSIEKISDNTYLTTVNGKQYEAIYSNESLIIVDKSTSQIKSFRLTDEFLPEGREVVIKILQRIPANMLMVMDKIPLDSIYFDADNSEYIIKAGGGGFFSNELDKIVIGNYNLKSQTSENDDDLANAIIALFIHEYGHYLDSSENKEDNINVVISSNNELNAVFKEEYEAYIKIGNTKQQEFIDYFISPEAEDRAASERVAEGVTLLNVAAATGLETRALYYQQNFPKTIAMISKLLDSRLENML